MFYEKYQAIINMEKQYRQYLLTIPFITVLEYLSLFEIICKKVSILEKDVMMYLSAAVSDFYVPESELAEHKIQSSAHPTLDLSLKPVPKLL